MKTMQLSLNAVNKVKSFIEIITQLPGEFDLSADRYVVNAKSLMGIFSLDLSKPLCLNVHNEADYARVADALKEFIEDTP